MGAKKGYMSGTFQKSAAPDCGACTFRKSCLFDGLSASAQKTWKDLRSGRHFRDGEAVFSETQKPTGMYVVCKGRVKVYSTDSKGQQFITWIRHPGEVFGHIAVFADGEHVCSAEAMGSATLSHIDTRALNSFMSGHSAELYPLMLKRVSKELRSVQMRLKDTAYKPAKSKVAETLIKSISYKSKNTPNPVIYGLKRTEIAEITGLALETVVRTLAEFEKKKYIRRELKSLHVLDLPTLQKIAGHH